MKTKFVLVHIFDSPLNSSLRLTHQFALCKTTNVYSTLVVNFWCYKPRKWGEGWRSKQTGILPWNDTAAGKGGTLFCHSERRFPAKSRLFAPPSRYVMPSPPPANAYIIFPHHFSFRTTMYDKPTERLVAPKNQQHWCVWNAFTES